MVLLITFGRDARPLTAALAEAAIRALDGMDAPTALADLEAETDADNDDEPCGASWPGHGGDAA